jgi:membrane-bound lytic murein transglycosylase B
LVCGGWGNRGAAAALVLALLGPGAAGPAAAADGFAAWLADLRREAMGRGVSARTLDEAFRDTRPIPTVIELDRRQPEGRMSFARYFARTVTDARVERGRRLYAENRRLLEEIGAAYGVQPRFLVALWGIETDFGRNTGGFRVVDALATLAHDGRRSAYFRAELLDALAILEGGHVRADAMKGSWAGAMGQCQFMPSSFVRHAVDHDGDGRRDIWGTRADVFASAANYLRSLGWDAAETWGREVRLPKGFDASRAGLATRMPIGDWARAGVRRADGGVLPRAAIDASLVLPDGPGGRAFLVYDNYRAIMHWNRSTYFATSVGVLAGRIGAGLPGNSAR